MTQPVLPKSVLRKLWPKAPASKVEAIARVAPRVFQEFCITTDLRLAHLMAQISHENAAGTITRESMNYSAPRMLQIFGIGKHSAGITAGEAPGLAHKPQKLAERVYGLGNPKKARELGNERPGDGWKFRGNGDLQLTGGAAHKRLGDEIDIDLFDNPQQLENAEVAFRCAVAEFRSLGCLPAADADDVRRVSRRVNGGYNGLAERQVWLRKWKAALAEDDSAVEAVVPPPTEPRGGESDQPKPLARSTIANGATVGGGFTLAGVAASIWDRLAEAPHGLQQAVIAAAGRPAFWCIVLAGGACAFIWWRRKQMQEAA